MEPYPIGDKNQVFIDGCFLEANSGIEFVVHPPKKCDQLCIEPDEPWEERIGANNSVVYDGERYRIWYTFFAASTSTEERFAFVGR